MRFAAFDPSSRCGWCHGEPGTAPIFGTYRLQAGARPSARMMAFSRFVRDLVVQNGITEVYFEEPIIPKVTSFQALTTLIGYAYAIGFACEAEGIRATPIKMQTWRSEFGVPTQAPRHITGTDKRREYIKTMVLNRCTFLGYDMTGKDDNAAEALGLWQCIAWRKEDEGSEPTLDLFEEVKL